MSVIALLAVGLTWLRPVTVTADEAVRIATDRFQKTPGAEAWKGCPTRSTLTNTGSWCVDFIDPATGQPFVQIMVNKLGESRQGINPCARGTSVHRCTRDLAEDTTSPALK